jgi:hypothetical protein
VGEIGLGWYSYRYHLGRGWVVVGSCRVGYSIEFGGVTLEIIKGARLGASKPSGKKLAAPRCEAISTEDSSWYFASRGWVLMVFWGGHVVSTWVFIKLH